MKIQASLRHLIEYHHISNLLIRSCGPSDSQTGSLSPGPEALLTLSSAGQGSRASEKHVTEAGSCDMVNIM